MPERIRYFSDLPEPVRRAVQVLEAAVRHHAQCQEAVERADTAVVEARTQLAQVVGAEPTAP